MGSKKKKKVEIRFGIRVPPSTPREAKVTVVGSAAALGDWKHPGLEARRISTRHYEARAMLPSGMVEFKITRGSWDTAEVFASGGARYNRCRQIRHRTVIPVSVAAWQDQRHRVRGPIGLNDEFLVPSQILGEPRKIMVHLPPGYEKTGARYPLLILQDGQNLFDDATSYVGVKWAVGEAVDSLVRRGAMEPVIAVGVWNSPGRMEEYFPYRALAKRYGKFLATELVPFLEKRYPLTRERMGVAGSSMGGIVSLYLAEAWRDLFVRVGALSPSIWAGVDLLARLEKRPLDPRGRRLWLDMGTLEGGDEALMAARLVRDLFCSAGWIHELRYLEVDGGRHHEWAWARRMPKVLRHLYPNRKASNGGRSWGGLALARPGASSGAGAPGTGGQTGSRVDEPALGRKEADGGGRTDADGSGTQA